MGVTAAIGLVVAAGTATFASTNAAAHQATNAHTAAAQSAMLTTDQVENAQSQKEQTLNAQASATAGQQARVRAISNPDGTSIMTSPLGGNQAPGAANLNNTPPGQNVSQTKSTLGG